MKTQMKLLLWTINTSFLSSLSLGTLNLRVAGFAFKHDGINALLFAMGAIITQMALARLALTIVSETNRFKGLTNILTTVTAGTMIILALHFLQAAGEKMLFPFSTMNGSSIIFSGSFFSFVTSLKIPVWMAWIAMLKCKRWFDPKGPSYNYYMIAIGLGSLLAFIAYGLAGYYLTAHFLHFHHRFNQLVGVALLLIASKRLWDLFGKDIFGKRTSQIHC